MPAARLDAFVPPHPSGRRAGALHALASGVVALRPGTRVVLAIDGIFLHRLRLADLWDGGVWVDVPFEVSVPRGNARCAAVGAEEADPASAANARYVGGQRLHLAEVGPAARATWVLDNTDLAAPVLTSRPPGGSPRAVRAPGG